MKKIIPFFLLAICLSCNHHELSKPKNLIDEDTMLAIMYDLSIIQAVKSTGDYTLNNNDLEAVSFLKNKYNVDEDTWHENNKYYASNINKYNRMVEKVKIRLEEKKKSFEVIEEVGEQNKVSKIIKTE